MTSSLTFLGAGRMAQALISGFLNARLVPAEKITLSSKSGISAQALAEQYGLRAALNNQEAIMASPVIFLCTKPAQALELLATHASLLNNKLIISVAAGIASEDLFNAAGAHARIIRTMPNIAVRIRKGVTTITPHHSATEEDLLFAKKLFTSVGTIYDVKENQINAATAVSGSGPAFALLFLEALLQGGAEKGLDPSTARALSAHALASAAALILETKDSPAMLRAEIASPKGTTEAGLTILQEHGLSAIVISAVHAATKRAEELSSQFFQGRLR
ncbi:MAG: pyrroline-5-carboxylate reductase [Chthoniobacterales bacterium]